MSIAFIKEDARRLIDQLPDDATWDDLLRQFALNRPIRSAIVRNPTEPSLRELLDRVTDENRRAEIDTGASVGKEAW